MREINVVKRNKRVLQLKDLEEFKKGDWLKEIPESDFLEVSYRTNNHILIINDMKAKSVKDYKEETEDGERKN